MGASEFLTVGKTLVLVTACERAVWGCIEHKDPAGNWVWRNAMFRNEGAGLSSDLVREATERTIAYWARHYGLPTTYWLRTEIDPNKTRRKRDPGRCFRRAGWKPLGLVNGLFHLEAPRNAMTLDEYEAAARRTHPNMGENEREMMLAGLGLAGEAGEFADLVKKHVFHKHPLDREKAKKELGDVLWYIVCGAASLGVTLEDVARANVAKLAARYPNGFSPEASLKRTDTP